MTVSMKCLSVLGERGCSRSCRRLIPLWGSPPVSSGERLERFLVADDACVDNWAADLVACARSLRHSSSAVPRSALLWAGWGRGLVSMC